jgi:hypothetical protein
MRYNRMAHYGSILGIIAPRARIRTAQGRPTLRLALAVDAHAHEWFHAESVRGRTTTETVVRLGCL